MEIRLGETQGRLTTSRRRRDPRFRRGLARSLNKSLRKSRLAYLTTPVRVLPDFVIIGSQRAGTSSLYSYLIQHPSLIAASLKEVHFFDRNYEKGGRWYRSHFPSRPFETLVRLRTGTNPVTGEATPGYMFHPDVPRRMAELVPHVKLIALLRNPVDRAYSNYCHRRARGLESLPSFEEAIAAEPGRLARETSLTSDDDYSGSEHRLHSYLARGLYYDQIKRWLDAFPPTHLLVQKSEDFFADPASTLARTLAFIQLPGFEPPEYKKLNSLSSGSMSAETRASLIDYFRPHNQRLYELLGRDFEWDK
jgi:Sulfotransferase domain